MRRIKMLSALVLALGLLTTASVASATGGRDDEVQAPRSEREEVQAPRGPDVPAPRGQDVQAPRSPEDVNAR
jgi:hypothetical protein